MAPVHARNQSDTQTTTAYGTNKIVWGAQEGDDVDSDDGYDLGEGDQNDRAAKAWKKYQRKEEERRKIAGGCSETAVSETAVWIYNTGTTGVSKRLHQVTCKTCRMTPIVGPRFASVKKCPDTQAISHYSLCEDCVVQEENHGTVVLQLDKHQDLGE